MRRASLAAFLATLTLQGALAQQAGPSPQIDLNRIERTFESLQREERRTRTRDVPLPRAALPGVVADRRPLVKLQAIRVEGANLVPAEAVDETYRPYLGRTVSQADLAEIAGRISELYRARGFHLSRAIVPPQDVAEGRIRIQVIEGRIADIVLKGGRLAQFGIRRVLDPVAAEPVSRRATLERHLLLVNDLPGVRIRDTAIEEIGTASGRFRLIVFIETWTNYTAMSLDNRGTPAIGPLQAYFSSSFNSALVAGDTFGVNASTVPDQPRELGFGRLFYNTPVGTDGARIGAVAAYSRVRPGDIRQEFDTRDQALTAEIRGSIVPLRSRETSLWLAGAFNVGEFAENDMWGRVYRDHTRTISLTADYQARDGLDGWNYLTMVARQGLGILGASERGDPFLSRYDGSGTFSKLELYYTRYQPLSDIWSLKLSMAGQIASTALLASQEFYLGSSFGRGFYGTEASGDNAVAGSVELRFDQKLDHALLRGYQLYGYVDRTVAWNFHSDGHALSLTLTGLGARFYLPNDLQVGVEGAVPVEYRTPFEQPREARVFFYISKSFKLCPGSAEMRCS